MRGFRDIEGTVSLDSGCWRYLLMRYKPSLFACTCMYRHAICVNYGWRAAHPDIAVFFSVEASRKDWQLLSPEDPLIAGACDGILLHEFGS